ncbi:hypothetical protein K402DRAFT_337988, partial [Aulographum hederae CBS 113979]
IRYFLHHPRVPRPLRFSRTRALRHWTIHRAWQLHLRQERFRLESVLQRNQQAMAGACEALRFMDADGMDHSPRAKTRRAVVQGVDEGTSGHGGRDVGRLYRTAMMKRGVWARPGDRGRVVGGFPIEYGRAQMDFPSRNGWNHEWKRGG